MRRFLPEREGEARWRSGYAEDCKSLHAGSIPARASTSRATRESAALAQLVEHIIRNDGVTGSSPVSGTTTFRRKTRNLLRKGRSAGRALGSCLGRIG